ADYLQLPTVTMTALSSISFSFAEEFDHRGVAMIEEETLARIKRGNRLHISCVEFEAEYVEVLRHSFLSDGLWNDDDFSLRQPSEDDLCDAFAVLSTNESEDFVVKDIVLSLGERSP